MKMKKILFNLQLFAEGGDGGASAASSTTTGSESAVTEAIEYKSTRKGKSNPLADVHYGKQEESTDSIAESEKEGDSKPSKIPFEDLIKGEYKEDFDKRTQQIINKRFKESKAVEEQLKSHDTIIQMLAEKYGIDSKDISGLTKAIQDDESFYEAEALEKGVSVEQLKEIKKLERENKAFRTAQEEQLRNEAANRTYAEWQNAAEALKAKYGLENFSLEAEVQNPDFIKLLGAGVEFESAYKAIHMDDMMGGLAAKTASVVKEKMASNIQSRQSRPAENGIGNNSSSVFKTDVNSLNKADIKEIIRRVEGGEKISF